MRKNRTLENTSAPAGTCPYCGHTEEHEYGNWEMDGVQGWYEVYCGKCKEMFHEVYSLIFQCNEKAE